jgi:hypothetical protein
MDEAKLSMDEAMRDGLEPKSRIAGEEDLTLGAWGSSARGSRGWVLTLGRAHRVQTN